MFAGLAQEGRRAGEDHQDELQKRREDLEAELRNRVRPQSIKFLFLSQVCLCVLSSSL